MKRLTLKTSLATLALLLPVAALAQSTPEAAPGTKTEARFRLERSESGNFVRLDTQTGDMTICRDENGNLACRMAADERAAYEREIELLEKRVSALEEKLVAGRQSDRLPGDEEIEKTLSIMERFMRRFMEIVQDFTGEKRPTEPQPNRT